MALVALLFAVSSLLHAHGSIDVTPVFVKTGENVSLIVTETPNDLTQQDLVSWSFNKKTNLVRFTVSGEPTVFDAYKGRIELLEKKFSVILKNLQDADSGVYTARVSGGEDRQITGYNVTVQAPVSPVTLTVDSVSNSSVSCNLTVSCRAQDAHINSTFTCVDQTCSQEGGERSEVTTSGSVLKFYLELNGSIICNHSNQVSWTKDMTKIQDFCPRRPEPQGSNTNTVLLVALIGSSSLAGLGAAGLGTYFNKKRKNKREGIDNTIYEIPQVRPKAQPRGQIPTVESSGLSSTYCTVGPHTGPEAPETRGTALPESLYAQVKHPKSSNNGSGV